MTNEPVDLAARVAELENAIRKHRDQKADDRCWLDDVELYKTLGDGTDFDLTLPPKECFLASCNRYWEFRQAPQSREWTRALPWPSWVTLLEEALIIIGKNVLWSVLKQKIEEALKAATEHKAILDSESDGTPVVPQKGDRVIIYRKTDGTANDGIADD